MPNINETVEVARKVLPIIYVLDTSGSMSGERIASVNEAMHDTIDVLKEVSENNPDAELKIGVLKFSSGAEWVTNGLIFMEDYFWNDLRAGGLTDFGSALNELNVKLSRKEMLKSEVGFCVPVIIFMSDGQPTDNYEKALANINETNKWFKCATKIGIAIGDEADRSVLTKVAGNSEAVVAVDDVETLKMLIRAVSVTSSMVGSQSHTTSESNDAAKIIDMVKQELGEDADKIETVDNVETNSAEETVNNSDNTTSNDGWDDEDWN